MIIISERVKYSYYNMSLIYIEEKTPLIFLLCLWFPHNLHVPLPSILSFVGVIDHHDRVVSHCQPSLTDLCLFIMHNHHPTSLFPPLCAKQRGVVHRLQLPPKTLDWCFLTNNLF